MKYSAAELIKDFQLVPLDFEGGYYKETYRSPESISQDALPPRYTGERPFSSTIYFLVDKGNFSAFHRTKSDEVWHFYAGQTLLVHLIHPNGDYELLRHGNDLSRGESFQIILPEGIWFACETTGEFSFVGCTAAPGFNFADFELANPQHLTSISPQQTDLINRLCR